MTLLAIDLFCGLGGWTEGMLSEGYDVVGFDIERHQYGEHRYPGLLVLQDVTTLHGSQFRNAALIVASPPCQAYSYRAMPWKRAKALPPPDNTLFEACFRIQREACQAAGRHIPLVVENVRGAQKWVGRARWNYGSFYLWGDVPALMPATRQFKSHGMNWSDQTKRGQDFTRVAGNQALAGIKGVGPQWDTANGCGAHGMKRWTNPGEGVKQHGSGAAWFDKALDERRKNPDGFALKGDLVDGYKGAGGRSSIRNRSADVRPSHGNSPKRKFASAMIAKIPLPLSRYIAATFRPAAQSRAA